uniref:Gst16 n=1 Tax=Arundo donax TaxID=35708 RepID=A0A0A9DD41_ARUDO
MKTVEEEHVKEELEKQQKMQRQTEPLPQFGGRDIRIDPQMQEGTKPQTVLVAPPSTGTVSTSISEHIKDVRSDDEKFKTERLQRKLTESEATELQPQPADSEEPDIPKKPSETLSKKAAEVDQNRVTSPAQEEPSVAQNAQRQAKAPPADPEVSDLSPLQVESKEDAKGNTSDERFKAERLKKMFYESEEAQLQSQPEDSQAPTKEEAPVIPKKPSDLQDIAKQDTMIPDNEKINGSPSTGRRAASTPTNADKSITISPPKGGMGQDDRGLERSPSINEQEPIPPVPRKSETTSAWSAPTSSKPIPPPIQQGPPTAPSTDKLDKAAGVDMRAPQGAPQQTPTDARNYSEPVQGTDPSTHVTSDEQSDKSSTMGERAPEVSPSKTPPSDSRTTSAPIQEAIRDAQEKQAPGGRGEIPDAGYSGDGNTTKKYVDKTTAEPTSSSQETTGPIKGVSPSTRAITDDESAKATMVDASAASPATVQAPASGIQNDSTVPRGGTADANGKNEAVIPSPADQRGMLPSRPGSLARTPDTQRRTASCKEANAEKLCNLIIC